MLLRLIAAGFAVSILVPPGASAQQECNWSSRTVRLENPGPSVAEYVLFEQANAYGIFIQPEAFLNTIRQSGEVSEAGLERVEVLLRLIREGQISPDSLRWLGPAFLLDAIADLMESGSAYIDDGDEVLEAIQVQVHSGPECEVERAFLDARPPVAREILTQHVCRKTGEGTIQLEQPDIPESEDLIISMQGTYTFRMRREAFLSQIQRSSEEAEIDAQTVQTMLDRDSGPRDLNEFLFLGREFLNSIVVDLLESGSVYVSFRGPALVDPRVRGLLRTVQVETYSGPGCPASKVFLDSESPVAGEMFRCDELRCWGGIRR